MLSSFNDKVVRTILMLINFRVLLILRHLVEAVEKTGFFFMSDDNTTLTEI